MTAAVVSISPLWYISRSAGFVGLALLGLIGILGIVTAGNFHFRRGSRFVTPEVHRSLSLLAVVILTIHVGAAILDKYSRIGLKDVFLPFVSQYRPIWIGLGAVAVDLGIAVLITSLLRVKMGYKSWKTLHWLSYPIFALSVIHGLGSGSDSPILFGKIIYVLVGGSLLVAILIRLASFKDLVPMRKALMGAITVSVPAMIVFWAAIGPFTSSWPTRAQGGLNQAILASDQISNSSSSHATAAKSKVSVIDIKPGYSSTWNGKLDESPPNSQGEIAIRLLGGLSSSNGYELSIVLIGFPQDGGVAMASSIVEVASTSGNSIVYRGTVSTLNGSTIVCSMTSPNGNPVTLTATLNLSNSGNTFTGTVTAS